MNPNDAKNLNRDHWDEAVDIHARGNVYGIEDFKNGVCQLRRIEVEEVGNVCGKSLLHLQCHFGLDTLSWARRGAIVTGADFSPKGIALARRTAAETNIADARFIETDIYELPAKLDEKFDIVFTSIGVLCWLNDINRWAKVVAHFLKPGGMFYIIEGHPTARVFPMDDDIKDGSKELRPFFPYFFDPAGMYWPGSNDYADTNTKNNVGEIVWQHSMSDILNALINAGLRIEFVHEFPFCVWKINAFMEPIEGGKFYQLPERFPKLPMMFSLKAGKGERV